MLFSCVLIQAGAVFCWDNSLSEGRMLVDSLSSASRISIALLKKRIKKGYTHCHFQSPDWEKHASEIWIRVSLMPWNINAKEDY
jgi:hypothetical protein